MSQTNQIPSQDPIRRRSPEERRAYIAGWEACIDWHSHYGTKGAVEQLSLLRAVEDELGERDQQTVGGGEGRRV
jgi:hypothetical protein